MKRYQKVFAVLFLLLTSGLAIYNIGSEGSTIAYFVNEMEYPNSLETLQEIPAQVDTILTENIVNRYGWIELYGAVHKILGKNEENNFTYVKDKNDFLYTGNFWNTSQISALNIALRIRELQDHVSEKGTKVVCVMYPTKYNEEWSNGYYGIPYNDLNEFADEVLLYLRHYNIDYIDFRDVFIENDMSMEELFYKTDHHWNIETAFFATGVVLEHLETEYNDYLDPDGYWRNLDNYVVEEYREVYLGSQGRETGITYVNGLDDFTFIYPKKKMDYTYTYVFSSNDKVYQRRGDTLNTLVDKSPLEEENKYEADLYESYLNCVCRRDEIINEQLENGRKMLFIRDSYSSPLATFLAPMCKEIDMKWSVRVTGEEIEEAVQKETYDYIFVALAIDNFTDTGIPFYADEINEKLEGLYVVQ